ncbi:MAG: transposase [Methylophilales bacterium]|nr:transposase [Methylophilales bacterium]
MPRRARLSLHNVPWHIIQRGNNRGDCFFADEDYQRYLSELTTLAPKFECAIHAYVLMTNHVHLLLTPKNPDSAALLMKNLGQRYVQYVNRSYNRSGTLWEGRFRSCLTQTENYVLACYRYIEMNPVRAGMVKNPKDYLWSSFHANGGGEPSDIITPNEEYLRLGKTSEERLAAYNALFENEISSATLHEIRTATNGNYALGNVDFKEKIAGLLDRRVSQGKVGRPAKLA